MGWLRANAARDKEIDSNVRNGLLIVMSIITLGQEVLAQSGEGAPTWRPVVMGKNGMVAAEHPLQALAGLRVLQSGGNAVDAAVAVFYMTAVTEPSESGLGGDGFMLAYIKSHRQDDFVDNLCRKMLAYALGRTLLPSDDELILQMRSRLSAN